MPSVWLVQKAGQSVLFGIATTRGFSSRGALASKGPNTKLHIFFISANSRKISASSVEGDHDFLVIVSTITISFCGP